MRSRRVKGLAVYVSGNARATAKTSPSSNGRIAIEPDDAYKRWVSEEPADSESPEWSAWMDRWPG